jgi:hypothetical protein
MNASTVTATTLYGALAGSNTVSTTAVNFATSSPGAAATGELLYNGTSLYSTINTTNGRGFVPVRNIFYLSSDTGAYATGNYFFTGTSTSTGTAINLAASSTYEVEYSCIINKIATTSTITFSLIATNTPVFMGGAICFGAQYNSTAIYTGRSVTNNNTLTFAPGGSISFNSFGIYNFKVMVITGSSASTLALQVSGMTSGGTMASGAGSYYTVTQIPRFNSGVFS